MRKLIALLLAVVLTFGLFGAMSCGTTGNTTGENNKPDNNDEPEYQEPTYVVWITDQGDTVNKLIHPFDFENMETREIIHTMIDIYMDECRNC
jgi:hypothetical protein